MRRVSCTALMFALCAVCAGSLGLDPTLREARLEFMAADSTSAADLFATWLDANPGSVQAPVVFDSYFDSEGNLSSLLKNAQLLLKTAHKGALLSSTMARIARLFEVAGLTEEARNAYLEAFAHGASGSAVESAFLLSLEMNDMGALQSSLSALKDVTSDRTGFLEACIAYQKGDYAPASEALGRIADAEGDQSIVLKALWLRYRIAAQTGDSSAQQAAARQLQARFPHSPECALAVSGVQPAAPGALGSITLLAFPGSFFKASASDSDSATAKSIDAAGPTSPPNNIDATVLQKTLSVQAGSFHMKENSEDLVSELTKSGFSPTVRADAQQGKLIYRVFVGRGLSDDEARLLLEKLHQAGFSGFLVTDQ